MATKKTETTTKKTAAKAVEKETVKPVAKAAENETAKAAPAKAAEKKAPAKKAPAKKAPVKKAPAKKAVEIKPAEAKVNFFVEFGGVQVAVDEVIKNVKATYGKDAKEISVYLKPEESKAYFVADGVEKEMDVFFC